jgi:signal transduction histidine kinase
VTVTIDLQNGNFFFKIQDTGIGIPKEVRDRIFTKFFRAPNAAKIDTEGSGLGLFVTKNIVESHGGKIWFESEEGKGTTFYFTIPVKKE